MQDLSGDNLDAALKKLDRFVIWDSTSDSYAISHPRFAKYRLDKLMADGDLPAYEKLFISWGEPILESLRTRPLAPDTVPLYLVRHYGEHLERSGAEPEKLFSLVSPEWRAAWEALAEEFNGYLTDVDRAHAAAARVNQIEVGRGETARFIGHQVQCSIVRAEGIGLSQLISGELVANLVRYQVWSDLRALHFIRGLESAEHRARALGHLAPHVRDTSMEAAVQILSELRAADPSDYGFALSTLSMRLASLGRVDAAQALVEAQNYGLARGRALIELIPFLKTDTEKVEVLSSVLNDVAASRGILRMELLRKLTHDIDANFASIAFGGGAGHQEKLQPEIAILVDALRFREDGSLPRVTQIASELYQELVPFHLAVVIPWLSADRRERELEGALHRLRNERARIDSESKEASTALEATDTAARARLGAVMRGVAQISLLKDVAFLGPYLRDRFLADALNLVEGFEDEKAYQALVWTALFPNMTTDQQTSYRLRIIAAIPHVLSSPNLDVRETYFSSLGRLNLSDQALTAIEGISADDWYKNNYLEALVPTLNYDQTRKALELTYRIRQEVRDRMLATVLERLASFGRREATEALSLGTKFRDLDTTRTAFAVLNHSGASKVDLSMLSAIDDRALRCAALICGSRSAELTGKDVRNAILSLEGPLSRRDTLQLEAFARLQSRMSDFEVCSEDALLIFASLVSRSMHPQKQTILIDHFRRLARAKGAAWTMAFGRRLSSPGFLPPLAYSIIGSSDDLDENASDEARLNFGEDTTLSIVITAVLLGKTRPNKLESYLRFITTNISPSFWWELHSRDTSLMLRHLPEGLQQNAFPLFVPESFFDGPSAEIHMSSWAEAVVNFAPILEIGRVRQLLEAAGEKLVRESVRASVLASLIVRLAALGHAEEAFTNLDKVWETNELANALDGMLTFLPSHFLARWLGQVHSRIHFQFDRDRRALLWANVNNYLATSTRAQMWLLLDSWLNRRMTSGEIVLDFIAYAPAINALGGTEAVEMISSGLLVPVPQARGS